MIIKASTNKIIEGISDVSLLTTQTFLLVQTSKRSICILYSLFHTNKKTNKRLLIQMV